MASPANLIDQTRIAAGKVLDVMDDLDALAKRLAALGGGDFLAAYFLESDGQTPRAGLDITLNDVLGVYVTLDAINTLLAAGHRTNLSKAAR